MQLITAIFVTRTYDIPNPLSVVVNDCVQTRNVHARMIDSPSRLMAHIGVNVGHLSDFAAEATPLYRPVSHTRSRYCGLHNELSNSLTRALASGFDIAFGDCAGCNHSTRVSSAPSLRWRLEQFNP